jgi:hypothetical protein
MTSGKPQVCAGAVTEMRLTNIAPSGNGRFVLEVAAIVYL